MKPIFYKKILKNGLTLLFEKRNKPVISMAFAVRCGGINESLSDKGISHFIEHLLYKGTKKRSAKKIAEEIEKNGGYLNGFTDESLTAYYCKIPSKHFELAFDVLSDMVKNPLFDEEEIKKEKQVIFEEIKMYQDNPMRYVLQEIHRFLYKQPFGEPLIGTEKTLTSITRDKILKRFQKIYCPNNMILCIVGKADFKEILRLAEKNFGNQKGKIQKFKIMKKNATRIEKRKGIDQANLTFAYHVPITKDRKNYAAFVLNTLMAGGLSSRLFQEIREKRNLAYAVKGESNIGKDFAYNLIYVGTKKEHVNLVKKIILEEFKKASQNISEFELASVKEQIIGNYQISTEDSQYQMVNLLLHEINGNAKDFYNFEKNILSVKLREVKELAKKPLKKYSFFALIPR